MKSPPDPESTKALAEIKRLPASNMTERIKQESELDEPVNVIEETLTLSAGKGVIEETLTVSTRVEEEGGEVEGGVIGDVSAERSMPGKS